MKIQKKKVLSVVLVLLMTFVFLIGCGQTQESAQTDQSETEQSTFPEDSIRMIIGFSAGGSSDISGRAIAEYMSQELGVPIVIENLSGAGGRIGVEQVYAAEPDGYTIALAEMPGLQIGQTLYETTYDVAELTFIGGYEERSHVIVVPMDSPYQTYADLVEASKTTRLKGAITGIGGGNHIQGVLFTSSSGLESDLIPYDGAGEQKAAIAGNQLDWGITGIESVTADETTIRSIITLLPERAPTLPDVPSAGELGYAPDTYFLSSRGIYAPPNLPDDVLKTLQDAFQRAATNPEFVEWLENQGSVAVYSTGEEYTTEAMSLMESIAGVKDLVEVEE